MSLLTFAAGRRSKYAAIALALTVALGLASQAAELDGATSSDPAEALPRNAESTAAVAASGASTRTTAPPPWWCCAVPVA